MFTNQKVDTGNGGLVPSGTLCWGVLSVRSIKNSQETHGEFADCELTVLGGPYENRKVFPIVSSPLDQRNKEGGRQMGFVAILHMVESAQLVDINNPASYEGLNKLAADPDFSNAFRTIMMALDGKAVAFKMGIKKDKDGAYPDKNVVSEWLSPNPTRSGTAFKGYQALAEGKLNMKPAVPGAPQAGAAATPAAGGAFGGAASAPVVAAPAFAAAQVTQPAVQQSAPLGVTVAANTAAPTVGPQAPAPAFLQGNALQPSSNNKPPF